MAWTPRVAAPSYPRVSAESLVSFPGRPRRHRARARARPRAGRHRLHPGRRRRPEGPGADPARPAAAPRVAAACTAPSGTDRRLDRRLAHGGAGAAPMPWRRSTGCSTPTCATRTTRSKPYARRRRRPPAGASRRRVLGGRPLEVRERVSLTIDHFARPRPAARHGVEARLCAGHAQQCAWRASGSRPTSSACCSARVARASCASPTTRSAWCASPLDAGNAEQALLASGTIPLVCSPVRDIPGAPAGHYWDGALVDYHLLLPYPQLTRAGGRRRIVFYPHFNDYVTPGWLDKHLPWRKAPRGHAWLDDMLLVAPSPPFLARLPNGKLPGPPGLLPLRPGPRGAHPRLGAGHRRVRALRRGRAALAGAPRPHPAATDLNGYHRAMDQPRHAPRRTASPPRLAASAVVRRIDVEISPPKTGRCACAISWTAT